MRGVDAVDVEARIGLGIAELLRLGQHLGEFAPALAHRRQDVVRGAVEDAVNPRHAVAGEALAQCLDDRDAAGDRGLEGERDAGLLGASWRGAVPCLAISALLAVTTCLPRASAVSTTSSAIPSAPPISSTTASISGSAAIAAASSYQRTADRSTPRSRRRSRAETATTTMRRPARRPTGSACRSSSWTVAGADRAEPGNGDLQGWLHR